MYYAYFYDHYIDTPPKDRKGNKIPLYPQLCAILVVKAYAKVPPGLIRKECKFHGYKSVDETQNL